MCDDGCGEAGPGVQADEGEWDFRRLVKVEELERTGVRGMLWEVQDASRAEGWNVPNLVTDVIEIAARIGSAQKNKAALKRSSAKMGNSMGTMLKNLNKARLAVEVPEVMKKALRSQVETLKGIVQARSEAVLNETKAAEEHWREKFSAAEVAHAAVRREASSKLGESSRNKAVQRGHSTRAEKGNAALVKCAQKMITKKKRLTARYFELALEN